ncbi:metal-sensitive transcriptional regulator [Leptospira perolatii]|uniref:metal-sensitive transcriptional regulator n=1 Tax=Leptospira perolatii TaxID=2023191 RepID=UPI001FAF5D24|nr:metal-sensitive transcriptional regulator [Leptospira perolatii]
MAARKKIQNDPKIKEDLENRLKRIEGQIRGVSAMVTRDEYCDDILNQISSVQAALNGVSKLLFAHHLRTCVADKIRKNDESIFLELDSTLNKMVR